MKTMIVMFFFAVAQCVAQSKPAPHPESTWIGNPFGTLGSNAMNGGQNQAAYYANGGGFVDVGVSTVGADAVGSPSEKDPSDSGSVSPPLDTPGILVNPGDVIHSYPNITFRILWVSPPLPDVYPNYPSTGVGVPTGNTLAGSISSYWRARGSTKTISQPAALYGLDTVSVTSATVFMFSGPYNPPSNLTWFNDGGLNSLESGMLTAEASNMFLLAGATAQLQWYIQTKYIGNPYVPSPYVGAPRPVNWGKSGKP